VHVVAGMHASAGAASPSYTMGMYTGNGGASAMQQDTTAGWGSTAMASEGCLLQAIGLATPTR
jgi:hypothetical protein